MLNHSQLDTPAIGSKTTWSFAGPQTAVAACESSLVARAINLLNRPPGAPRERRPELATLNTPPSSCVPLSRAIDGSLLKPPVVPSQSGLSSPADTPMLVDMFSEPFPIDSANLGSAGAKVDLDASLQSWEGMMSSCNEAFDTVHPNISKCEATIGNTSDVTESLYEAEGNVPSVMPLQFSSTFGYTHGWPTDSARDLQLVDSHSLKQEGFSLRDQGGSHSNSSTQSAIASFFSPSTASETSLVTNEDWFALLDLGDGEESTSVLNRMSWGENMPEPQFGPPFEVLPSAAQIAPDSWGCGIEQLWAQYAAASVHLYDTSAAFAALNPYPAGLQATCPQSDATSLYLDASALAEINSLAPPVIPASASSTAIVAVTSEMKPSRIQSSGALVKTKSAAARKETRQARAKIPAAPMAQSISEHDGTSSECNTILADLASQPVSPGARGQTSASIFAVPLNDASLISGESAGPVPNQQCTGRRSGPAESKPPPKRRSKSKVGPRLLCHQPGCGKSFSSQHNLNEHRQVHEYPRVQRYFCREGQCALETKGFNFKRDLTRHYRQKHPWVAEKLKEEAARQVEERRAAVARKKAAMAAARAAARERVAAIRKAQKISFRVENEANGSWSGTMDSEMQMIDGR